MGEPLVLRTQHHRSKALNVDHALIRVCSDNDETLMLVRLQSLMYVRQGDEEYRAFGFQPDEIRLLLLVGRIFYPLNPTRLPGPARGQSATAVCSEVTVHRFVDRVVPAHAVTRRNFLPVRLTASESTR